MAHTDDELDQDPATPLGALIARASELGGGAAPVERWNPADCGRIPMRIAADGTWHYHGSPIRRERLVRLFASVLRREPDASFVLVTPVEKVTIDVDDAPFVAVELVAEGEGAAMILTLRTNVGDVVTVDADHPLRAGVEAETGGFLPYVRVRGGLEARLTRPMALELADLADESPREAGRFGVWSAGTFFPLDGNAEGDA